MKYLAHLVTGALLIMGTGTVWAHEGHSAEEEAEEAKENTQQAQTLKGEVVDVLCYLSHGKDGLGAGHAGCAKKCIGNGLPVAIKVGDQLYLATMADHTAANIALADLAGQHVTVQGDVMEKDGQHLIAISKIEKAN